MSDSISVPPYAVGEEFTLLLHHPRLSGGGHPEHSTRRDARRRPVLFRGIGSRFHVSAGRRRRAFQYRAWGGVTGTGEMEVAAAPVEPVLYPGAPVSPWSSTCPCRLRFTARGGRWILSAKLALVCIGLLSQKTNWIASVNKRWPRTRVRRQSINLISLRVPSTYAPVEW